MLTPARLSFHGRYAYRRQLPAEVLNTFGTDTALLGQFVLTRLYSPEPWETTLYFSLLHTSFFFSPWFAERMRGRPTRPFFYLMIAIALPAYLAAIFTRGFWGVGASLLLANVAYVSIFVPLRNRLMRSNYSDLERGACYAVFKRTSSIVYFLVALWAAHALGEDRDRIHQILPVAGVLSAIGLLLFARIPERGLRSRLQSETDRVRRSFVGVYRDLLALFRTERRFFLYQVGFFLYGMGFMFTAPREMEVVDTTLGLDYATIVLGVYGITPLAKMVFLRYYGALYDRAGPWRLAAVSFALLGFYPLAVFAAAQFDSTPFWFAARASFGLAMAGIDIAWSVGPLAFGSRQRASTFSAAHIFAVGFRASIGPAAGLAIYSFAGTLVFPIATAILLSSGLFMHRQSRVPAPPATG